MIRLLTHDDVEAFRAIRLEALREEPAAFASTAADWERLSLDEWRNRLVENSVFVASQNDEPVGIIGLAPQRPSKMAHRATIIMVYVRKNVRGTGLAVKLLRAITDHAWKCGIRQLELMVSAENPAAQQFYRRAGFAEIGRVPGGFIHEGREIDDVMMARRIEG
jgi:RimJ/RimL family protein N-acetyltransferase